MKTFLHLFFFFLILIDARAQDCKEYSAVQINDTTNFRPLSYRITYNSKGLPTSRINLEPGTEQVKFIQTFYYTGNRLDSLMGYVNNNRIGKIFSYDMAGNLISILGINPPYGNSYSYFTYNGNKLSGLQIQDLGLKCTNITYSGAEPKSADLHFWPYGGSPFVETCSFIYDSLPNSLYNKIGIVDNPLLYLTPKTFLGFKSSNFHPYKSFNVKYDAESKLVSNIYYSWVFTDILNSQKLGYKYMCDSFLTHVLPSESSKQILTISPNPSENGLFLVSPINSPCKVYTISGDFILETNNQLIDLSAQPSGVYVLKVGSAEGNKVYKLIKN